MKKLVALLGLIIVAPAIALAAATVVVDKSTLTERGSRMDQIQIWGQITLDATYATGGEAVTVGTINTALTTAGYKGSCTTLERMYVANGEVSDSPYFVAWDDENGKLQVFGFTAGTAVTVATGSTNVPTAVAVITAEAVAITTVTGALAQVPISIIAADIAGGTSDGKAANIITTVPDAAQEVRIVPGTKAVTINASDATAVNVTYAYISTVGTAANLATGITGGTASTLAEVGAIDLSSLEIEFFAVCTQ